MLWVVREIAIFDLHLCDMECVVTIVGGSESAILNLHLYDMECVVAHCEWRGKALFWTYTYMHRSKKVSFVFRYLGSLGPNR